MQYLEIFLIALGLSFDTFAVSISTGLTVSHIKFWQGIRIAFVLAFFQTLFPLIGWLGGSVAERYIESYDHWIAFGLLSILGIKMIIDTLKNEKEKKFNPLLMSVLIGMAIATSIDALVVGVSLGLIKSNIYLILSIIGAVTFIVSMIGMLLGKNANGKLGKKVEILGGLILIFIGFKILLNHLLA